MPRTALAFLVAAALAASPALAARLTPLNIQNTFATGVIFIESVVRGETYNMVFRRNGTAQRTALSNRKVEMGMWRAADTGYCVAWGSAAEQCFSVEKAPDAITFDVYDAMGQLVA